MAELAELLLGERDGLFRKARRSIELVCGSRCHALMMVYKRQWCIGARACHANCQLKEWFRQTQDERFRVRAERCGGRCMAWDLVPEQEGAELWHGHWFVSNQEIDRSRLGYHDEACPLRNDRNTLSARAFWQCTSQVFQDQQVAIMRSMLARLSEMEEEENMNSSKMFMNAMKIERMKKTLQQKNWIPSFCEAKHVLDPWAIQPKTVDCARRTSAPHVVEANDRSIADLQSLVEGLSAAAVLTSLFSDKNPSKRTLGTLSVNVVFKPVDPAPEDIKQQKDAPGEEEDPDQLVTETVDHAEPAAFISEVEAQIFVDIQQADFVQRNIGAAPLQETRDPFPIEDLHTPEDIFKGRVNRMTQVTRHQFLEGASLRRCREALASGGHQVEIPGGCLVFVYPFQYNDVLRAVDLTTLTHADIIFSESLEYEVEETLKEALRLGSGGAWMKSRDQLPLNEDAPEAFEMEHHIATEDSTETSVEGVIEIDRTFLTWRPVSAASNSKAKTY